MEKIHSPYPLAVLLNRSPGKFVFNPAEPPGIFFCIAWRLASPLQSHFSPKHKHGGFVAVCLPVARLLKGCLDFNSITLCSFFSSARASVPLASAHHQAHWIRVILAAYSLLSPLLRQPFHTEVARIENDKLNETLSVLLYIGRIIPFDSDSIHFIHTSQSCWYIVCIALFLRFQARVIVT